jgi:hypothetical protein
MDEAFATILEPPSTLWQGEKSFEENSPSMLAANYHAKNIDDMIPTHLCWAQWWALWHILKKHSVLVSGKLGKLHCKPVHLELTYPNAKLYHGKPYQVPCSLLPILKKEVGISMWDWSTLQNKLCSTKQEQADSSCHKFLHVEPIPMPISISITFNSRDYAHCWWTNHHFHSWSEYGIQDDSTWQRKSMTHNNHPPLGQVFLPKPCDGIICQPQ